MLSKDPELTPEQIDDILEHTAVKLSEHKNNDFGAGRIDALAAVNAVIYDATEEDVHQQVMVYPNPSTGAFNIVCEGMKQIEVYSLDGRLMQCFQTDSNFIQLNDLEKGIYLLQVTTTDTRLFQKIVKH